MSKAIQLKWSSVATGAAALLIFGLWLWPRLEEDSGHHQSDGTRLAAAAAANTNFKSNDAQSWGAVTSVSANAAKAAAAADAANAEAAHVAAAEAAAKAGGGVGGKYWAEWADGRPRTIDTSVFEKPPGTLASVVCMTALPERLGSLTELSVRDLWLQPDLLVLTVPATHEVDGKKGALPSWIAKYEEKVVVMRTKVMRINLLWLFWFIALYCDMWHAVTCVSRVCAHVFWTYAHSFTCILSFLFGDLALQTHFDHQAPI